MGAPNKQTSGPEGKRDTPGKEAMLEAMKRQQMNDMVNQSQRMQQQPSSEYFPSTQGRQVMNQPVPEQEFKTPAKGAEKPVGKKEDMKAKMDRLRAMKGK